MASNGESIESLSKKMEALMAQTAEKEKRERLEFAIANAAKLKPIPINGSPADTIQVKPMGFELANDTSTSLVELILLYMRAGNVEETASIKLTNETGDKMKTMKLCDMLVDQIFLLTGVKPHFELDSKADKKTSTLSFWYSEEEFDTAW